MHIIFKDDKVEKQCRDLREARKLFPDNVPKRLFKMINFIEAADNLQSVISNPSYHFHNLKGENNGLYAMDIAGRRCSYRLIVTFGVCSNEQIFHNSVSIQSIKIEEVSNHYE